MEKQSFLTDAKNEYIRQLYDEITPTLIEIFNGMYSPKKPLIDFQKVLKEIKAWNQTTIDEHTGMIVQKCPYFEDLLTAIFVTFVRIMTTFRLTENKPDVNVKIPKNNDFIHALLIEIASKFYTNPYIFKERNEEHKKEIIRSSIDKIIRKLLPVQEILSAYLGNSVNNGEVTEQLFSEDGGEPFVDNDPEPEPETSEGSHDDEDEDDEPNLTPLEGEDEVKVIPGGAGPTHPQDKSQASQSFFDDAGTIE